MILTAMQELLNRGSLQRIKPVSWKILLLISLFTLGAWNCFLRALSGISVFEFGAMSLLSPVVMATLAMLILRESPSAWIWPSIGFGIAGTGFGPILAVVGRAASPDKRSLALGITTAAGSAGQVIGPPTAAALLNVMPWSSVFIVFTIIILITLILVPLLKFNPKISKR